MAEQGKRYRFRYSNYTVEQYVQDMRARAMKLRREADLLTAKAEGIEIEADLLQIAFVPAPIALDKNDG